LLLHLLYPSTLIASPSTLEIYFFLLSAICWRSIHPQSHNHSASTPSTAVIMEAILNQSKAMCPFLMKTSPATLRSLSSSARHASPGGGSMSNLQTIARRCPVMGQALAVQTAKSGMGKMGLGSVAALGAIRAFTGKAGSGKARIHTSRPVDARAVEDTLFGREKGDYHFAQSLPFPNTIRPKLPLRALN
jgi:5-aminolevulinate synthase